MRFFPYYSHHQRRCAPDFLPQNPRDDREDPPLPPERPDKPVATASALDHSPQLVGVSDYSHTIDVAIGLW